MSTKTSKLSLVVPCYNEEETIDSFYQTICPLLKPLAYEIEFIFVDDGSTDQTSVKLDALCEQDLRVKRITLSRNFGKEGALLAGLEATSGDAVIVMDIDLQDPPELIPQMVAYFEQGFDHIYTRRRNRKGEPVIRSWFANLFYKLMNRISEVEMVNGMRDYRLLSRQAVEELLRLKETNRFSKGLFQWIGFGGVCLEFDHVERVAGQTKWSFFKLLNYAIEGITSFSNAPLRLSVYSGVLVALTAFAYLLYIVYDTTIHGNPTAGWSSMVCVTLFLGGIQLICLGVVGEYVGRIYSEVKQRPPYIVKERSNFEEPIKKNALN